MKKILAALLFVSTIGAKAQSPYYSYEDSTKKGVVILNGIISKYILMNNDAFAWYNASHNGYSPNETYVKALDSAKGKFTFLLFGGTWCEDTQFILPKFFKLQEEANIADTDIGFIGVNRRKKSLGNLADAFNIVNVPTIIVLKGGKEVGRVVEYGKTGQWDKELVEIVQNN